MIHQSARIAAYGAHILMATALGGCAKASTSHPRTADAERASPPRALEAPKSAAPAWGDVELPLADNAMPMNGGQVIVVRDGQIFLDGELVGSVAAIVAAGKLQCVDALYARLRAKREKARVDASFRGRCNFVIEPGTPALVVKSVLQTAGSAGFPLGAFVVRRTHPGPDGAIYGLLPADAQVPGLPGGPPIRERLAPEIIQRVVREHFRPMQACYEAGLRRNPTLQGRVTTRFVIGVDGHVSRASPDPDSEPSLPDASVVACVIDEFSKLAFPPPNGGIVTVVYPIIFSPGD